MPKRNTTRYIFSAYGYDIIIGDLRVNITNRVDKYNVVYDIPEHLHDISLYQPGVSDVLKEMIKRLIN